MQRSQLIQGLTALAALVGCLAVCPVRGQTFQRTFGTGQEERAEWVAQTSDGGYVIAGWRGVSSATPRIYVLKLDPTGALQWERQYNGLGIDVPSRIAQTPSGDYVIAGETNSSGVAGLGTGLVRLDSAGNLVWSYAYPGTAFAGGGHGQPGLELVGAAPDGGFVLCGRLQGIQGVSQAPILIRVDRDGNLVWAQYYTDLRYGNQTFGGFNDVHTYITPAGEIGLIAAGYTAQGVTGSRDSLLVATDPLGNIVWAKTYGDTAHTDFAFGLHPAANGDILMNGFAKALGEGGGTYLLRTNGLGTLQWYRTYRFFSSTNSMQEIAGGDIILAGNVNDFATVDHAALLRTTGAGALQWCMGYGGANQQYGECAAPTSDGGFKVVAWTNSFGLPSFDIYSIKTDANGRSGCNEFPFTPQIGNDQFETDVPIRGLPMDGWEIVDLQPVDPGTQERILCEAPCVCPGDLNGDCVVNITDLGILLGSFGQPGPGSPGDVDGDGDTDISDLGLLLSNFGLQC